MGKDHQTRKLHAKLPDYLVIEVFSINTTDSLAIDNGKRRLVTRTALSYTVFNLYIQFRVSVFQSLIDFGHPFVMFAESYVHGSPGVLPDGCIRPEGSSYHL